MIERITNEIYRIAVPLPDSPLRELNSYLIRSGGRELLIDTGFHRTACLHALNDALERLGSRQENRDVLLTHMHADHSGLAQEMCGRDGKIYISDIDLQCMKLFLQGDGYRIYHERFVKEGMPREVIHSVEEEYPASDGIQPPDGRYATLEDGAHILVGKLDLQVLLVPGHTPGSLMLYLERERILFTGDHVLFDISPNITAWPGVENALGDYLHSLRKYENLPVALALPAHHGRGDYHWRTEELLTHYDGRLAEVKRILKEKAGQTAYEICGQMTWHISADSWLSFPDVQKWFAMGECLSHLDYLVHSGQICRGETGDGIEYSLA